MTPREDEIKGGLKAWAIVLIVLLGLLVVKKCYGWTLPPSLVMEKAGTNCLVKEKGSFINLQSVSDGDIEISYDRNGDELSDLIEVYERVGLHTYRPFPYKVLLDIDYDGTYDVVWMDGQGDGRCQDLKQVSR